jgi:hypothetical protein
LQPKEFSVGDIIQLVGIEMQDWNGSAQLSGKNVQIGVAASQGATPKAKSPAKAAASASTYP